MNTAVLFAICAGRPDTVVDTLTTVSTDKYRPSLERSFRHRRRSQMVVATDLAVFQRPYLTVAEVSVTAAAAVKHVNFVSL